MQRCQPQPRTFAIAASSPACASLMASWTPARPRLTRPLRNPVQNAFVSASPTSIERISRRPVSSTPWAMTNALLTTRPPSWTFSTFASRNRYGYAPSSGRVRNTSTWSSSAWQTRPPASRGGAESLHARRKHPGDVAELVDGPGRDGDDEVIGLVVSKRGILMA